MTGSGTQRSYLEFPVRGRVRKSGRRRAEAWNRVDSGRSRIAVELPQLRTFASSEQTSISRNCLRGVKHSLNG